MRRRFYVGATAALALTVISPALYSKAKNLFLDSTGIGALHLFHNLGCSRLLVAA